MNDNRECILSPYHLYHFFHVKVFLEQKSPHSRNCEDSVVFIPVLKTIRKDVNP